MLHEHRCLVLFDVGQRRPCKLLVDQRKIVDETRNHLGNAVSILPIKEFGSEPNSLARGSKMALTQDVPGLGR